MAQSYRDRLLKAMREHKPRYNRRHLKELTGFSYEHIRKVCAGLPIMSEQFNDKVCGVLGIDPVEMWQIALREKIDLNGPSYRQQFADVWDTLSIEDQARVLKIAVGIAEQRAVEKSEREEDDPETIRERIAHWTDRLVEVRSQQRTLQPPATGR